MEIQELQELRQSIVIYILLPKFEKTLGLRLGF